MAAAVEEDDGVVPVDRSFRLNRTVDPETVVPGEMVEESEDSRTFGDPVDEQEEWWSWREW